MKTELPPQSMPAMVLEGTPYALIGAQVAVIPDPNTPGKLAVCVVIAGCRNSNLTGTKMLTGILAVLGRCTPEEAAKVFQVAEMREAASEAALMVPA